MLPDMRIDGSPAGQILKLLQQQGPLSIKEIEAALGVTTTAVRQQLVTLMTTGMVTAETVREKRGRPHAVYRLAEKGQELFAHGYEELALALLEEVLYLPDTATVHQMLHRASARLGRQFAERMRGTAVADEAASSVARIGNPVPARSLDSHRAESTSRRRHESNRQGPCSVPRVRGSAGAASTRTQCAPSRRN